MSDLRVVPVPAPVVVVGGTSLRRACGLALLFLCGINAPAATPPGLVADFRFSGAFHDLVQGGGGLEAAGARFVPDRLGQVGAALSTPDSGFVGSRGRDYWKNRRAWTWAGWIRADRAHAQTPGNIFSEGNQGGSGSVSVFQGAINLSLWNEDTPGGWSSLQTPAVVRVGEWQQVTATFAASAGSDQGTAAIYLNGGLAASGTMPMLKVTGWRTNHHEFAFGNNVGLYTVGQVAYPFFGSVDDVQIFDRALSPDEVAQRLGAGGQIVALPALELLFQTAPGARYQLQWSDDLSAWANEDGTVAGTGGVVSRFVSTRGGRHRYWRLLPLD